ncbi:ribokinase [Cohaesibacter celericrescens]|uniref:Ribokinase n=1 Tax=Cohaesibacter celericrescens TaxID=2067669 RepID=A0A2N5XU23_9HYPH|nr:ribokinase [Cohaesibacter celericrescens]PLW77945.1 ribokinase [Cohaesibacter celericrescens]
MNKNIAIVGSINVDLTTYLDRWPQRGETIKTRETKIGTGGKGANQCCAVAKLGGAVTMIGAIGDDGFGRDCEQTLKQNGAHTAIIVKEDHSTGMAFIDVGPEGDNIIRITAGANGALNVDDIKAQANQIQQAAVLLFQNEVAVETSVEAARLARQTGALSIMDPAPAANPPWDKDTLNAFDIITPNGGEAGAILGRQLESLSDAALAAKDLASLCRVGSIVTMGHLGVAWYLDGIAGQMDCPKVNAIDTVAAGDCFNGAFAFAVSDGMPYAQAIHFASHAASLSTTRRGAVGSLPTLSEVREFIAQEVDFST